MYLLSRDGEGKLRLEVLVAGFAMESFVVVLSTEEEAAYEQGGKAYLDILALRICSAQCGLIRLLALAEYRQLLTSICRRAVCIGSA